jgi:hypothetical protein
MKKNLVLLFALLTPWFAQAAIALPQARESGASYKPKAYSATYSVFRNGKELGITKVVFSDAGNGRWQLTTDTSGTSGLAAIAGVEVNEHSLVRWNDGRPETIDYSFAQKAGWKNKQRSIRVNAQSRTIDSRDNEKFYTLKYEAGVLDRHAITIAVMQDLSQGKRGDLRYPVANRDELETQLFRVTGNEKVETPMGVLNGIKVQRVREDASGKTTTLWLGADKQFVPLRIEQKESSGDSVDMRIRTLR